MVLTIVIVSQYMLGLVCLALKRRIAHAALMLAGVLLDVGLTLYLIFEHSVLGKVSGQVPFPGSRPLLIGHLCVAVTLLVCYAVIVPTGIKLALVRLNRVAGPETERPRTLLARHRWWAMPTMVSYVLTICSVPAPGSPAYWLISP